MTRDELSGVAIIFLVLGISIIALFIILLPAFLDICGAFWWCIEEAIIEPIFDLIHEFNCYCVEKHLKRVRKKGGKLR